LDPVEAGIKHLFSVKAPQMRVVLRKVFGEGVDDDVLVTVPNFLIGRSSACHLRPACFQVSRIHCELIVRDGYVAVRDLGSKNGTFVNNDRVATERQLLSGDNLGLGMCLFEVIVDELEESVAESQRAVLRGLSADVAPGSHTPCEGLGCLAG